MREEPESLVQNCSQILHIPDVVVCGVAVAGGTDDRQDFVSETLQCAGVLREKIGDKCDKTSGLVLS